MANPADLTQGTLATKVNPANWNTFVDRLNELGNKVCDVKDYGAAGDGTDDYAEILAAHVAATVSGSMIVFPSNDSDNTYRIDTSITFNADTTVAIAPGATLKPDSGVTITINGPLIADLVQIFDVSLGGTIVFAKGYVKELYPQWWGAIGNGAANCTSAFDAAMLAAHNVGTVKIPTGAYIISTPLRNWPAGTFSTMQSGINLQGNGTFSELIYTGTEGFCLEITNPTQVSGSSPIGNVVQDIHMSAPNIADPDDGGCIAIAGPMNSINRITIDDANAATGIMVRPSEITQTEDGYTTDADLDFTTTGAGASEKYAVKFETLGVATCLYSIKVRLGKTGAPAGTIHAELWSDVANAPGAQLGVDSNTIACTDLSADADGAYVVFTWKGKTKRTVVATTSYWAVISTTGYTYADGVTEVRLRVDTGDGAVDGFGTYDFGVAWGTSNDGANHRTVIFYGQALQNRIEQCSFYGTTRIGRAIWLEGGLSDAVLNISNCFFSAKEGILSHEGHLFCSGLYLYTTLIPIYMDESNLFFTNGWVEGGADCYFGGVKRFYKVTNTTIGATNFTWESGAEVRFSNNQRDLTAGPQDGTVPPDVYRYKVFPAAGLNKIWEHAGDVVIAADADALNDNAVQISERNKHAGVEIRPSGAGAFYDSLPRGTYKLTLFMKDSNQLAADCGVYTAKYITEWYEAVQHEVFTLTADYEPYTFFTVVDKTLADSSFHGINFRIWRLAIGVNTISISHAIWEYMGPDTPARGDLTTYNLEASDADGARQSSLMFYGRQSGLETLPMAEIQASHDGAADDTKGKLDFFINDGSDEIRGLTKILTLDSTGAALLGVSSITFANTGLHILDTGGDHDLIISPGTDLSADKTLTLTTGDADRTITFSGDPTLDDWFDQAVKAASSPAFAGVTLGNEGLHLLDTNASHDLIIKPGSDLDADYILTLTTGNAARTVTLSGDPTLADWFDQAVKAASSPAFAAITLGNTGLHLLDTNASHDLIIAPGSDLDADYTLTLTTGNADRTITLSGNPTLADWFDQDVKVAAAVTFDSVDTGQGAHELYAMDQDVEQADFVIFAGVTLGNEGLHILDTGGDHDLIIKPGSDLDADYILTLTTGNAARTITLSGNPTLGDWFDQAVKVASSPEFATVILGAATTLTDTIDDFDAAEALSCDITGVSGNNPVIRRVQLYIYNDPGADQNIPCRLSFYNSDSKTEDELLIDFYFNLSYTEINNGAGYAATDTAITVDTSAGLVKYDLVRFLDGTPENQRITATPTATVVTVTQLAGAHADNTGVVRVAEIAEMWQAYDADGTNELHVTLEFLEAPNADTDVAIVVEVQ